MKDNNLSTKTPSKYLSLRYLYLIKDQYYCNPDTGADYNSKEVDALILYKEEKIIQDEINHEIMEKEIEK